MSAIDQRLTNLNLSVLLSSTHERLETVFKKASGDEKERLLRVKKVLPLITRILKHSNVNNTSINVFQRISDNLSRINDQLSRENIELANLDTVDDGVEGLLEAIPLTRLDIPAIESIEKYNDGAGKAYEDFLKDLKNRNVEIADLFQDYSQKAKESLDNIKKFEVDGKQLAHYLSGRALEGFFADRAKEEKKSAWWWTAGTWVFAGLTLIFLVGFLVLYFLGIVQGKELDWQLLGTKALVTATIGLIAKWTSKRANRHLTEESKYHRLAVNMKTIDSFIASLDQNGKNKVVTEIAIKTFAEVTPNEISADYEGNGILDGIRDLLNKMK